MVTYYYLLKYLLRSVFFAPERATIFKDLPFYGPAAVTQNRLFNTVFTKHADKKLTEHIVQSAADGMTCAQGCQLFRFQSNIFFFFC